MKKEQLQAEAKKVLRLHNLKEVYMTSDGQAFTKEHHANDHARVLNDKKVQQFSRAELFAEHKEDSVKVLDITPKGDNPDAKQEQPFDYEKVDKELLEDREFLIARHEALEGKKPAHNIGTEKLAEKVQELEKERFEK